MLMAIAVLLIVGVMWYVFVKPPKPPPPPTVTGGSIHPAVQSVGQPNRIHAAVNNLYGESPTKNEQSETPMATANDYSQSLIESLGPKVHTQHAAWAKEISPTNALRNNMVPIFEPSHTTNYLARGTYKHATLVPQSESTYAVLEHAP